MLSLKERTMLGDIPYDWDCKPLSALLSNHYPGDWGDDRGPHMVKVIRSTNFSKDSRLNLDDIALRALPPRKAELLAPKRYDILLERSGGGPGQPVGRVGFIERDLPDHAFSNFLHLLRPNPQEIVPRFLGWVLYQINQTGRIIRLEQQTTQMRNLHFRDYLTMPLPLPPPHEQGIITEILDGVDAALECTCVVLERARTLRRSLLAILLSRGIGENGTVRDGAAGELILTRAGLLPAGWKISSVGTEFDIQSGFTLNAERRTNFVARRYLRVANVQRDALSLDDIQLLGATDDEFLPRQLELDDLLVVEGHADRMQIGRCARVTPAAVGMTFQNHLFRLRSVGDIIPAFGCLWLNSSYAQRFWNARCATSSGLNTINQRMLRRVVVPIPSLQEQKKIIEAAAVQQKQLEALIQKRDSLEALKRALLHDLLTGRVRVAATQEEALAS